ncbi:hypothetical protein NDU88_002810 [Pleurodeles waltl]|uniref:Uncharacterized protein n=1 Tax=Pleurodeles waltl TaxID=8319 RepID=A0AAV7MQI2_PLEWA|nr:hypothetical protein NDU88_002810 [Pleurodeles waltl]
MLPAAAVEIRPGPLSRKHQWRRWRPGLGWMGRLGTCCCRLSWPGWSAGWGARYRLVWCRRLLEVGSLARGRIGGRFGPRLPATPCDLRPCGSRDWGWGWSACGSGELGSPSWIRACRGLLEFPFPAVSAGWLGPLRRVALLRLPRGPPFCALWSWWAPTAGSLAGLAARLALCWRRALPPARCEGLCLPDQAWGCLVGSSWEPAAVPCWLCGVNCGRFAPLLGPAFLPFGTGSLVWCIAGLVELKSRA